MFGVRPLLMMRPLRLITYMMLFKVISSVENDYQQLSFLSFSVMASYQNLRCGTLPRLEMGKALDGWTSQPGALPSYTDRAFVLAAPRMTWRCCRQAEAWSVFSYVAFGSFQFICRAFVHLQQDGRRSCSSFSHCSQIRRSAKGVSYQFLGRRSEAIL